MMKAMNDDSIYVVGKCERPKEAAGLEWIM